MIDLQCFFHDIFFFHKNSVAFAISWCFAIGISLGLVAYGMVHARRLRTVRYDVRLGEGKKDYRMILLSDLHIGAFVGLGYIKKVVEKVNSLSPDMVVITGDIFNNGYAEECGSPDAVGAVLGTLQTKDGVYAVLGNHDPAYSDEKMRCFFKKRISGCCITNSFPLPFLPWRGETTCSIANNIQRFVLPSVNYCAKNQVKSRSLFWTTIQTALMRP